MLIRTILGSSEWECIDTWHGEPRRVFKGTLMECLAFRKDNEE